MTRPAPSTTPLPRLIILIVIAGVGAGAIGSLISFLNKHIETLAFGFDFTAKANGVGDASWSRRLLAAAVGGIICGVIWWRVRPRPKGSMPGPGAAAQPDLSKRKRMPIMGTALDALAQMMIVGSGISQGREPAPRQFSALGMQQICDWIKPDDRTRQVLISAAAGAGLAAVYNIPFTGAIFALESIVKPDLRTRRGWSQVLIAAVISQIATIFAWLFNHNKPIYEIPHLAITRDVLVWAIAMVPISLIVGVGMKTALIWAKAHAPATRYVWFSVPLGALLVAIICLREPRVAGNGQVLVQAALTGGLAPGFLLCLAGGKLLAVLVSFKAGSNGGILTPSLAVGAACATSLAGWAHASSAQTITAGLVCAACVLSITNGQPGFAALFTIELAKVQPELIFIVIVAVTATWAIYKLGQSLHARLSLRNTFTAHN